MNEENEEFERELNYKPPSQVAMEEQAREFADGQEEEKDNWIGVETAKYLTVLDFEAGRVFQYNIGKQWNGWDPDYEGCEDFLTNKGHNLTNCEWMAHEIAKLVSGIDKLQTKYDR